MKLLKGFLGLLLFYVAQEWPQHCYYCLDVFKATGFEVPLISVIWLRLRPRSADFSYAKDR